MIDSICSNWCPPSGRCLVTSAAIIQGINMRWRFTRRGDVVMTIDTGTIDLGVVYIRGWYRTPRCGARLMAGITNIRGIDMVRRLIMTAGAGANYFTVIHIDGGHRRPGYRTGLVASVTGLGGSDMRWLFTRCSNIVMTTYAGASGLSMVHSTGLNRCPGCRPLLMAGITQFRGCDMCCRFTRCG
jgi:hypothetical protein